MDNADLSVLRRIRDWRNEGHAVVMGTIVRTWGSAHGPLDPSSQSAMMARLRDRYRAAALKMTWWTMCAPAALQ